METRDHFGWVGRIIDAKYRVERAVGEGAFGVVYRAHHLAFDAPVALKGLKMPPGLDGAAQAEFLQRFFDEGRLLHRLSRASTGIVQALDLGAGPTAGGASTPYLVLEWLEGVSLDDDLADRARRGERGRGLGAAIALLEPAAHGLAVAHRQHIAHCDVKPGNLFLARVAGSATLKLLDFGIAQTFGDVTALGGDDGPAAFSPRYAAPEQFDGQFGPVGPWTDVFALALTLIEVASGRPALEGRGLATLFLASADRTCRPSLRARGVACSDEVEGVLRRALAVDPGARFRTALEFWTALRAAARLLDDRAVPPELAAPPPPLTSASTQAAPPTLPAPNDVEASTLVSLHVARPAPEGSRHSTPAPGPAGIASPEALALAPASQFGPVADASSVGGGSPPSLAGRWPHAPAPTREPSSPRARRAPAKRALAAVLGLAALLSCVTLAPVVTHPNAQPAARRSRVEATGASRSAAGEMNEQEARQPPAPKPPRR